MPQMFGYGEDALTYWALSTQLVQLLRNLNDDSAPGQCRILYRPSFGRKGGPTSSQFGEFDAILQTARQTYLIESKWDAMEAAPNDVVVDDTQVLRHRIFKWIREKWTSLNRPDWTAFVQSADREFRGDFDGRTLANPGTLLAQNCQQTMLLLQDGPRSMKNVLLYFSHSQSFPRTVLDKRLQPLADPFQLCLFGYAAMNDSGFFPMAST